MNRNYFEQYHESESLNMHDYRELIELYCGTLYELSFQHHLH